MIFDREWALIRSTREHKTLWYHRKGVWYTKRRSQFAGDADSQWRLDDKGLRNAKCPEDDPRYAWGQEPNVEWLMEAIVMQYAERTKKK